MTIIKKYPTDQDLNKNNNPAIIIDLMVLGNLKLSNNLRFQDKHAIFTRPTIDYFVPSLFGRPPSERVRALRLANNTAVRSAHKTGRDRCVTMVVGVFPLAKLGALILGQLSKPIANFAKERAKNHHIFRNYICMPPAQAYNWCEIRAKMWVMHLGKPISIPRLNEAMAIELGANLLGEAIIFVIAAGVVYAEFRRQNRKESSKENPRKEELSTLAYTLEDLVFQVERRDEQLSEITQTIYELKRKIVGRNGRKDTQPSSSQHRPTSPPPPPSPPLSEPTSEDKIHVNHSKNVEDFGHDKGIVLNALRYLQINDLIGQNQRYHTT